MLHNLRKASDSTIFRALLAILVVSFAIWQISDVIRGRNDFDIVKFKNLPSITLSNFYETKRSAIQQIQMTGADLNEENLQQLGIDKQILSELITKRLVEGWIDSKNIIISDKLVAEQIKKQSQFNGENGKFNIDLFKKYIANLKMSEDEFYSNVKFQIAKRLILGSTTNALYVPSILQNIIVDHLAESRNIKYVTLKLSEKNHLQNIKASDHELEKFYKENQDSFRTQDIRKINYLLIKLDKLGISSKAFDSEKDGKKLIDAIKSIEDDVAGGDNISEIAKKYSTPVRNIAASLEKLSKDSKLGEYAEQIFSMEESEVSYPAELKGNEGIILFEVEKIQKGEVPPLASIKQIAADKYIKSVYISKNIEELREFESRLQNSKFEDLAKELNFELKKATIEKNGTPSNLPTEFVESAINYDAKTPIPLIILDDEAYLGYVENVYIDKKQQEIIRNSKSANIVDSVKNSLIDEIISYFYVQNSPETRIELLGGQS